MLSRIRFWLRALVRRPALEREMREEMQAHLDRQTALLVARGMSESDARVAARRDFGNVGVHQEDARDTRPVRWLDSIGADVRFAGRFFARKPLSSATIVLVLAFGIAGYSALFGIFQSAVLRPPPGVPADVPLVLLRAKWREQDRPKWSPMRFAYPALQEVRDQRAIFEGVAAWTENDLPVSAPGAIDRAWTRVHFVTDGYFSIIGVRPQYGSALPSAGPGESQLAAVISDGMWEDAFARKDVRNLAMSVNGVAVRIVGVAPRIFSGPLGTGSRSMIWLPLDARQSVLKANNGSPLSSVDSTLFKAVARLAPTGTPEQAAVAIRLAMRHSSSRMTPPRAVGPNVRQVVIVHDADAVRLAGASGGFAEAVGGGDDDMTAALATLTALATLILLVVCTNVAGLVVSASVGRRQEIAVRLSLGASRTRVIRQLVTESVVLSVIGGALALLVYWGIIIALSRIPMAAFFRPDLGTVAFTMLVALGTGVLCGLSPALHATRDGVGAALKDSAGATRRSRLQHAFVVAQVTFTQPLLLLVATLVASSFMEAKTPLPDGRAERVLQLPIDFAAIPGSPPEQRAAVDRLLQRLRDEPGVVAVTPQGVSLRRATIAAVPDGRTATPVASDPEVFMELVKPGYFELLGLPLLRGNDLAATSDTSATIIIGSDLARTLWGDADPIGRRLTQLDPPQPIKRDLVVSGVYDSRYVDFFGVSYTYRPVNSLWSGTYLIRTATPATDLASTIRRIVREELPSTRLEPLITIAQEEANTLRETRGIQAGVAAAGALVLLIGSIGLYGAVALGVGQRRREIGVRMALGAGANQVVALFYARGVKLGVIGLVLGLPLSLVGQYVLNAQGSGMTRPRVTPSQWLVGSLVALIVLAVASIATLIPASRAARVNPVTALRGE